MYLHIRLELKIIDQFATNYCFRFKMTTVNHFPGGVGDFQIWGLSDFNINHDYIEEMGL